MRYANYHWRAKPYCLFAEVARTPGMPGGCRGDAGAIRAAGDAGQWKERITVIFTAYKPVF